MTWTGCASQRLRGIWDPQGLLVIMLQLMGVNVAGNVGAPPLIEHALGCVRLQVDPDAEAAEAERATGKSSAAGLLCSGPPAASKALDF
jgi:hypothetical protein